MRTDPTRSQEFVRSEQWGDETFNILLFEAAEAEDGEGPPFRSAPFSGGERNRLFLQREGNFDEMTLVSGVDFRQDGRGFALFDYNRDGFMDMAIMSPNYPRLRIVKNVIGERLKSPAKFVELKLVGGQTSAEPSELWSARDAFGSTARVTIGEMQRMFQLSGGEGLSSQNASQIHIGMGQNEQIDKIEITWPSGKTTVREGVSAGERITIYENPEGHD